MGLFSDFIEGAINSAINFNDKDHFFKILCLVIFADNSNASVYDIKMATLMYNTMFPNESMIEVQIQKKLKSAYQDIYNSNKSPEEIIKDIETGRIDRNKLKIFFICACFMAFAASIDEELNKKKIYMVYLIKVGFKLTDDEVNDAYLFARNNGLDDITYQNIVTALEEAFEYFDNNDFDEED
ncbi:hypothetical protein [Brachyspira catarrhinii]|uniref:TerB family tellurite resistance protein n=1 Tax=Brachyspira catarrhinii TaxID=2528966 RepID=A0ABY2TPS2_9SPIR|nr:hypothetical protein [Brachyspira catarrhinii]TKZ33628.1 hypothetical protein EZH24_08455 [Brachyspira catarrhinii]